MNREIDNAMHEAVNKGIFPSAQLIVKQGGRELFHQAYGNSTLETLFDIASLTKPLCTTTLVMQLVAEDKLRLNDQVNQFFPQCEDKKNVTIRHLLNHSSGLPAWQPFYQNVPAAYVGKPAGKKMIIEEVINEPLEYETGEKSIYSDLGYILLGEILERVTKKPLDRLFSERIAKPLGLKDTFFVGIGYGAIPRDFAPTEDCPWRKKVLQGQVHDQNCYAMGGIAGHAGLFSNTKEISLFLDPFLSGKLVDKETIDRFLPFNDKLTECNSTWLLGWDRPNRVNSQAGSHFSERSIGHLGYTGCSMWIDLTKDYYVALLTNRIHPSTTDERIRSFRPILHNIIFEELIQKL